jgi:hypothetical protein
MWNVIFLEGMGKDKQYSHDGRPYRYDEDRSCHDVLDGADDGMMVRLQMIPGIFDGGIDHLGSQNHGNGYGGEAPFDEAPVHQKTDQNDQDHDGILDPEIAFGLEDLSDAAHGGREAPRKALSWFFHSDDSC